MFLADDNALQFEPILQLNTMDFFYHCSYKLDKNKINQQNTTK